MRNCLFFSLLVTALTANPAGGEHYVPGHSYTEKNLRILRQWENKWVGEKIGKNSIDAVAKYLPESYVQIYKNPEQWGAPPEGLYFFITPYRRISETKGVLAATRQYASSVIMEPDGSLKQYASIAGIPFPVPQTGLEVAWNFDFNTHGDASFYNRIGNNIIPANRVEQTGDQDAWELFWIHRVDLDPRPAFKDNPKGIARSTFYHMYSPPEFKNTRMYNLRYIDAHKSDTAYMWYSAFRRIQRISNSQRTDTIDGTDLIYDDEYFWDGQILRNTYRFTGRRELLCARHQDISRTTRQNGQALLNNLGRERLNTLEVEVISRDPNYIYGKRIWYVDPETYLILWTEIYDQHMRFWKCFENITQNITTRLNEKKNFIVGSHYVDFQRRHAGTWRNSRIEVSVPITQDMFSVYNLQKDGY